MRICSLGTLTKVLPALTLALVVVACGTSVHPIQPEGCGCAFLYATASTNSIIATKLDRSGVPGAAILTPGPANSQGIASDGSFLYVSDPNVDALDSFTLNPVDGTFTPVAGSPFALNVSSGSPAGITMTGYSVTKSYLYAGDTNGKIAAFEIGPAVDTGSNWVLQGNLTPIAGSPYAAGTSPLQPGTWASGQSLTEFVYAPDVSDPNGGVYAFSVGLDGTLSPVPGSPFATAPNAGPVAVVSAGIWVYVALSNTNQIAAFTADSSGALTPLPGSPYPAGRGTSSLIVFQGFLYALNDLDHSISAYSMDPNTGILTAVSGSPFTAGSASGGLATYPSISTEANPGVLYAPDPQSESISAFSINQTTGQLTPLAGSPYPVGVDPIALTIVGFPGAPPVVDPP